MKPERRKRLTNKELDALLGELRRWPKYQVDKIALLVHHIRWCKHEIDSLTAKLHEYEQADFFRKQKELETPKTFEPRPPPPEKYSLAKRLRNMIDTNATSSEEWQRTLK